MMLHHTITIYLLVGSYIWNMWECGAIIFFLHDTSDIPGHLVKALVQTIYDKVSLFVCLIMMATWFYMRCFLLPYCIYYTWNQGYKDNALDRMWFPKYGVSIPIFNYFLCLLVVLHYYWFSLFCKMLWNAVTKNKYEDL